MMLKNDDNLNCSRGWYTISMKISSLFVFCFLSIRSDKLGALSDPPDSIHLTAGSKYQDIKNNNKMLVFTIGKSSSDIFDCSVLWRLSLDSLDWRAVISDKLLLHFHSLMSCVCIQCSSLARINRLWNVLPANTISGLRHSCNVKWFIMAYL